jgi:GxxExxY protein
MNENKIATLILDACFKIHRKLGPGLFESVYEEVLSYELEKMELDFQRQKAIPVIWEDFKLDQGFRADFIVEGKVIVELKSIEAIAPVHHKQLLTYLRLTNLKLGLLINFNEALLREGIQRIVNNL